MRRLVAPAKSVVRAGLDHGHVHAERGDLLGQRLGQALDRPLGGVVGADRGVGAYAALARDLQDPAGALGSQHGQDRLGDPDGTEEVRLHLGAQVGLGELLDHAEEAVTGVVDDDVEPPEPLHGPLDGLEGRLPVGDVEGQCQDVVAVAAYERVERGDVTGGRNDSVAAPQRGFRTQAAEAARGAGDEPDLGHDFLPPGFPAFSMRTLQSFHKRGFRTGGMRTSHG